MTLLPIYVGVGVRSSCSAEELAQLVREALSSLGVGFQVQGVATLEGKAAHPAISVLAYTLGVPTFGYEAGRLDEESPRLAHPSDRVEALISIAGVAEAAALAVAGPDARLVVPKMTSRNATCALATPARSPSRE
ncbi:cobalamin biosynthesis protein [Phaeovibrio sulfidiphilus]|uniref:Cobalamin biosynthesis protein n=1 Tax=Phaeovibrio sulfidiphilus TaxID=1220600 RepID=A0A8J6YTF9_9PROT|nr:cobalamin biosynthesis protein [Phaeovibrio sulfidiphilus]MBE1236104.1 cobalamin biosynthesis protein [Phaeovibrio sulfidiphilus]